MTFSAIVLIPYYNHPRTIGLMVARVLEARLPCLIIDDGSSPDAAAVLDTVIARSQPSVQLLRLPENQGKGAAVAAGLRHAYAAGYTHAVQIDADGQHDTEDLCRFVATARTLPHAVICGQPLYDSTVPKGRLYARYLTHVWVWINTLSLDIRDSMCGFRVYPIAATLAILDRHHVGRRMDFDTEVLVRLHWEGARCENLPTRVTYPADGVSHFKVWKDNVLISCMHARLFFGMLRRMPRLLARKLATKEAQS